MELYMKKNSFIKGTISAYLAIVLTKVIGVLYVIPFYRLIGPEGRVIYSYAYNIYNLILSISTSGIPTAIAIVVAEYSALKQFENMEYSYSTSKKIILIMSLLAFSIMFVFAPQLANFYVGNIETNNLNGIILAIRVMSFCLLTVPFLSICRGYLQGNKYISVSSFSQLLEQIVRIIVLLIGSYIAIKILNLDVEIGVAVALSGTFFGGLVALLFLLEKIKKSKKEKIEKNKNDEVTVSFKAVALKILKYAIPVIIVSVTQNLYETVDLKLIIVGLNKIGFDSETCQQLASTIVTWTPKICMIINAIALGLCTSVIAFTVDSYIKKKFDELNNKYNQAINTILFVGIPLAFFIFVFAKPIFFLFYEESVEGSVILSVMALLSILFSIDMVVNMILQSMKMYKIVYINTIVGLTLNALLDVPMILLLNKIKFYPYLGTIFATVIGQIISILIVFIYLKKKFSFKYSLVFKTLFKTVLSALIAIIIVYPFTNFLVLSKGYISVIMWLGISGILFISIYCIIAYLFKVVDMVFGKNKVDVLLRKFRINKGNNKD